MLTSAKEIHEKANRIVRICGTRDPLRIAPEIGIHVKYGDNFNQMLGMYTYLNKERHIVLNSSLDEMPLRMVCGHEIGHDTLHRKHAKGDKPFSEFQLFDMQTRYEYEANAFAAHLIIDDDEMLYYLKEGYDVVQVSSFMGTNINLMLVKLNEMNRMGWHLNLPYIPHSDFLKNIRPE